MLRLVIVLNKYVVVFLDTLYIQRRNTWVCIWWQLCYKTCVTDLKVKFYRVFNCIYSRSKAANSEMITVQLLKAYCLPLLLYASEAILLSKSINNCRSVYKILGVTGAEAVNDVQNFIALDDVAVLVERRTVKFVDRLIDSNSYRTLFLYVRPSFCSF